MQALKSQVAQRAGSLVLSALLAFPTFALAQDPQSPPPPPPAPTNDVQAAPAAPEAAPAPTAPATGGWKRVGDQDPQNQTPPPPPAAGPESAPVQAPPPPPPPQANGNGQQQPYPAYGQPNYGPPPQGYPPQGYPQQQQQGYPPQGYPQQQQPNYAQQPVPASLTVPSGTYVTVRINQMLSSDRNQVGDSFSATLLKPIVVNGVVIAEPGQTIGGHVAEAVKAGRVSGVAHLGVQLTDLTLVDGQQIPLKSSLVSRTGPNSVGQDAGTIAGTTALGAAVGAAAAWGKGAAIGAGSGAVLGIAGVLLTRGHPSVLYPEQILTFRIEAPLTIDTTHAPQAFRYVEPGEYSQPAYGQQPGGQYGPYTSAPYPPAGAPAPYYYGYGYPYPYPYYAYGYPYYWGPGFSLWLGGRGYYGYGRGYYYGGRYYAGPLVRGGVVGGRVGGGVVGGGAHISGGGGGGAHSSGGHR